MLSEIQTALETLGLPVFYGAAGTLSGEDLWDYVVFYRTTLAPTGNKRGMAETYEVALVCEEFIPDETISAAVGAMTAIPGMKLADTGGTYQYTTKPNTNQVIEILTLDFVRPMKRCPNG